jgi:NAD(P)-dependent dehydrogenase (short-subunit alcohol dehydrogenase family)
MNNPLPAFRLDGKVALVAGGAGYLGGPVCHLLASQGAQVIVADLSRERGESLVTEICAATRPAAAGFTGLDIGSEASIQQAIQTTVEQEGRLDILVNATCATTSKRLEELTAEDFDRTLHLNLTGSFLLARAAAAHMQEGSSQVFFSSMYGEVSPDPRIYTAPLNPNPVEYGVAKSGINQMVKYLSVHWAPKGIRVNAVAPGPFPNPTVQREHPDFVEQLMNKVPLRRIGRQDELSGAVVWLASDQSSYVTGQIIRVDGGWTAW